MWHCPSCGAPQTESARCWVCRRSSTTCSTCTHFRPALAGELGYCGRDARRLPLTGLELRGCWEAKPDAPDLNVLATVLDEAGRVRAVRAPVPPYRPGEASALRDFVPVDSLEPNQATDPDVARSPAAAQPVEPSGPSAAAKAPPAFVMEPDLGWNERTTLFGDPEG